MKSKQEITELANWCLNCNNKPCSLNGCPMQTNIPEFINKIKSEEYEEAYKILMDNNIFSHVCSIVCPQEDQCKGSCIRGIKQTPTRIGELEKFVNEWAKDNDIEYKIPKSAKNGKKVAIIGSGPAGLECAIELLKNGFDVTIFEKNKIPGGILWYGIPEFRMPKIIVIRIIERIQKSGAKFETVTKFGDNINLDFLRKKYDAVFIGIGAEVPSTYSLTDKKIDSIYDSNTFLKAYNEHKQINYLGKVIVIGGGNVAMDSARVAIRMGAEKSQILYRRDKEHMPARKIELQDAIDDGVEFMPLTRVVSANIENGEMVSVNCIHTKIVDGKAVDVENSEFEVEANTVIFAIGLKPEKSLLENQGIKVNEWGMAEIDENGMTNLQNVYAGGDVTESKSTVCRAIAAGKRAAEGIMKNLK